MKVLAELDNDPRASTAWVNESTAIAPSNSHVNSRVTSSESHSPIMAEDEINLRSKQVTVCEGGPRDSVENMKSVLVKNHSKQKKVAAGSRDSKSSVSASQTYIDRIAVCIELLSNWDHPRMVGLTELELLDQNDKQIEVIPTTDVVSSVAMADGSRNDIGVLFDGVYKVRLMDELFQLLLQ